MTADLPLPENAAETYIISKGSYWCGDHAVARDAFVAGWAQGAAAEREHRGECWIEAGRIVGAGYELGRAAEREAIRQLAEHHGAEYPDGDDGENCCDADCHMIWRPFADIIIARGAP